MSPAPPAATAARCWSVSTSTPQMVPASGTVLMMVMAAGFVTFTSTRLLPLATKAVLPRGATSSALPAVLIVPSSLGDSGLVTSTVARPPDPIARYAMLPPRAMSLALPGIGREATIWGAVRFGDTLTTCSPDPPAATNAKSPETSTELARPGMLTNETAVGEKLWTTPAVVAVWPWLVAVMVQVPLEPANT